VLVYGLGAPAGSPVPPSGEGGLQVQTALAAATLTAIYEGIDAKAIPGIERIKKGLSNPGCDPTETDKADPSYCGISQAAALVSAGIDQLVQSISDELVLALEQALDGGEQVAAGADELSSGLGQLSDGATQVAEGSDQLAEGTNQAAEGSDKLAAGNELLAVGANKLATGLGDAADGSAQLAQGLGTAADGAPALRDGAQQLSDEGTKKLIEAGKATSADYGAKYAMIEAGAERSQTDGMAYGAPEGAAGATAYSIEIAGVDSASTQNLGRLLGAIALFGVAAGAVYLRRRTVV
jgi:putative membrane protein